MKIIKKGRKYYKKREHDVDEVLSLIVVVITIIFVIVRVII